jgi:hypothetical protein
LLIETLAKCGLGIGAMIKISSDFYWEDSSQMFIGLIQDFEWVSNCNFIEAKNLKYSKQVRLTSLNVLEDFNYRRIHMRYLRMGNGSANEFNLSLAISRYIKGEVDRSLDRKFEVSCPSHDIDYNPEVLVRDIVIPDRLLTNEEKKRGISRVHGYMPADVT